MLEKVSVIIPCRNEEKYIEGCVRSLLMNGYDPQLLEVLVVDGVSTDNTPEVLNALMIEFPQVRMIPNNKKVTPNALNLGIQHATGDYILIASAHSSFIEGYIETLVQKIKELPDAIAVGGVMRTEVKNETKCSLAIREILSNPFGVGNAMFRVGVEEVMKVDTVPFGLYRATLLKDSGGYDERLIRNHDIELSKRLLRGGGNIFLIPKAECTYYARETYMGLARNNYRNGKWNILTVVITKNFGSLSLRHFIPLIFVLSLILPLIFSLFWWPLCLLSALSFLMYIMSVFYFSLSTDRVKTTMVHLLFGFFVLHFSYGLGSLNGFFILPKFVVR
jgi:glycosyltransferase involved in cell wall biosynthesis